MAAYKLCLSVLLSLPFVILAKPADSDPPPFDCPQNEVYMKCALERCFNICNHLVNYPACPMLMPGCVDQACVCRNDYLRNDQGVCVYKEKCPEWLHVLENNEQFSFSNLP